MDKSKKALITKIVVIATLVLTIICVWTHHVRKVNTLELAVTTPDGEYVTDNRGKIVTVPRTEKADGEKTPGLGLNWGDSNVEAPSLSPEQKYPVATNPDSSAQATMPGGIVIPTIPAGSGDIGVPGNPNNPSGGTGTEKPIIGWDEKDEVTTGKNTPEIPQLNTKAEIVAYFNQASNGVKSGRPALDVKRSTTMAMPGMPIEPGTANETTSYKKGTNLKNVYPVYGEDWASKLPVSGVKSAVCVQEGRVYKILITLNDEKNPNVKTSAHALSFGVLDPKEMQNSMSGDGVTCKDFVANYTNSKISAVIDVKTGRMLSSKYNMRVTMSARMSSGGPSMMFKMQMDDIQEFKMTW